MLGWLNTLNLSDSYSCGEEEHAQREAGQEGGDGILLRIFPLKNQFGPHLLSCGD